MQPHPEHCGPTDDDGVCACGCTAAEEWCGCKECYTEHWQSWTPADALDAR